MIRFRCQCGVGLKAPDEQAGRRVACPACKAVVKIPLPARSQSARSPSSHKSEQATAPDGEACDEAPPTRRNRAGRRVATIVVIACFLVAMVLLLAVYFFRPDSATPYTIERVFLKETSTSIDALELQIVRNDRIAGQHDSGRLFVVYMINSADEMRGVGREMIENFDHALDRKADRSRAPALGRYKVAVKHARDGNSVFIGQLGRDGLQYSYEDYMGSGISFRQKTTTLENIGIHGVCPLLRDRSRHELKLELALGSSGKSVRMPGEASITIEVQVWQEHPDDQFKAISELYQTLKK